MSAAVTAWRADWVVPVSAPPVPDGLVVVEAGRITAVGAESTIEPALVRRAEAGTPVTRRDLGHVALMPALVNAHTHLELSWMAGRLPAAGSLPEWAQRLVRLRATAGADEVEASALGIEQALACGTGVIGDISNSLASCGPLARSPLRAVVFHELLGLNPDDPARRAGAAADRARAAQAPNVGVTLAAHAPYSVAPALFREIACAADDLAPGLTAVHLAESPEETEFLLAGTGPWRALLEHVGTWTDTWVAPRCGPVAYLAEVGFLRPGLLAAHGVQLTAGELDALARAGATIVTCPRSNARLGVGRPPVPAMLASGVNLAIGTDSLASNDDLNVFAELAALRALAPEASPRRLLQVATLNGARALRVDQDFGTLDTGRRADLIAVGLPAGPVAPGAVEEFLVRGVEPSQIAWVRA
jgi:cytosine/adenosine deaminase-related metal-dependent hydrolase